MPTESELAGASYWTRRLRDRLSPDGVRACLVRREVGGPGVIYYDLYRAAGDGYGVRARWHDGPRRYTQLYAEGVSLEEARDRWEREVARLRAEPFYADRILAVVDDTNREEGRR